MEASENIGSSTGEHVAGGSDWLYRFMRDPNHDRRRKTLLRRDPFDLAAQTESFGQLAAVITKVARKYGLTVVVDDQNLLTFMK
jgi:hypothetical protein